MSILIALFATLTVSVPAQVEPSEPGAAKGDVLAALEPTPGGLTAADVVRRALDVSARARAQRARAESAGIRANLAFSGFVPRVNARYAYTRLSDVAQPPFSFPNPLDPLTPISIDNPFPQLLDRHAFRLGVSVPLSDYLLTILPAYRITRLGRHLERHRLDTERESAALVALMAYYDLAFARAYRRVAERSVEVLTGHLEDLVRKVEAGYASDADRLQVAAQLAAGRVEVQRATGGQQVARTRLRLAIRATPGETLAPAERLLSDRAVVAPEDAAALEQAKARRPEVIALKRAIEQLEQFVHLRFGRLFPGLQLSAGVDYANPNNRIFPQEDAFEATWDAGLSVVWSPDSTLVGWTEWRGAEQDVRAARAELDGLLELVELQTSTALTAFRTAASSIQAASEALDAAAKSLADRSRLVAAGESTASDLLDAEAAMRRAELQSIEAHVAVHRARAQLDHARGRLVEETIGSQESQP